MKLEPQLHERDENDGNRQGQAAQYAECGRLRLSLLSFDGEMRCR